MADAPNQPESPDEHGPEQEFQEMLRKLLSGDANSLAAAAGVPAASGVFASMLSSLRNAMNNPDGGVNWNAASEQAQQVARAQQLPVTEQDRAQVDDAFRIASLWLGEATSFAPATDWSAMNRTEWADTTMPFWSRLCEPVATSISDALLRALSDQIPEEMSGFLQQTGAMMRTMASTVFVVQLGQVVGRLASEVVSANEIGVPVVPGDKPALIPQNVAAFGAGIDVPMNEVTIYLATRELAHVALFRSAPWLTSQLALCITEYAQGLRIEPTQLERLSEDIDPTNLDSLRAAVQRGDLIPPKTEQQLASLERLETLLTLIEGWVDVATADATERLPHGGAIAEMFNRRRATGGPAEHAFGTLVGLELRPRSLRKAATLWRLLGERLGTEQRDALWQHPDILPTQEDFDDPEAFVRRTRGEDPDTDFDRDLERLLSGELPDEPGASGVDESGAGESGPGPSDELGEPGDDGGEDGGAGSDGNAGGAPKGGPTG